MNLQIYPPPFEKSKCLNVLSIYKLYTNSEILVPWVWKTHKKHWKQVPRYKNPDIRVPTLPKRQREGWAVEEMRNNRQVRGQAFET